jgi:hypothetical protein
VEAAVGGENINSITTAVAQKLSKSNTFDATIQHKALAVLSRRFALDICFGHPDAVLFHSLNATEYLLTLMQSIERR